MDQRISTFEKLIGTWQNLQPQNHPTSLKQSSILLKVLTTASTSRMYVTSTCLLTNLIGIYKRSKEDLAFSKGIFLQKRVNANPLSLGFQGVLRLENPPLAVSFKSCCHGPSKARAWNW